MVLLHWALNCQFQTDNGNRKEIVEKVYVRFLLYIKYAMASSAPYIVERCILIYHTLDGWLDPSVYFVYFANANQE